MIPVGKLVFVSCLDECFPHSFNAEGFYHKVSGSPLCSCSMVGSPTSVMSSHALGMVSNGDYSFTENL